jgi:hypothetical protein
VKLDEAAEELEWPSLVVEARDWIGYLTELDKDRATDDQHRRCASLIAEIKKLIEAAGHAVRESVCLAAR